jgi:hypothetical protein
VARFPCGSASQPASSGQAPENVEEMAKKLEQELLG